MDYDKLAAILVRYSTAVRPGEVVSLLGPHAADAALRSFFAEVLRAGGHPFLLLRPDWADTLLCHHGTDAQLTFTNPLAAREVEVADVAIHVTSLPAQVTAPIDPARLAILHAGRRPLVERFRRRVAQGALRWTATAVSPSAEWQAALIRGMRLEMPDPVAAWREQAERQARLIAQLETARALRFVTPTGTNLRVDVAGCGWHNGAGHENFPDGEVWTVPVKDSTEGSMVVDFPVEVAGRRIRQARLTVRAGRVVEVMAAEGKDTLRDLLARDPSAGIVGEVALGCNYAITEARGHPLLDEKIGGTFHIALGDPTHSAVHLDLIGDLRPGGRVEADGRLLSAAGRFVDPRWPGPAD